jgi:hypothetical protein
VLLFLGLDKLSEVGVENCGNKRRALQAAAPKAGYRPAVVVTRRPRKLSLPSKSFSTNLRGRGKEKREGERDGQNSAD